MNLIAVQTPASSVLIVVPVFNHAATLVGVLRDLVQLGLPVLVVDDGSQDGIDEVMAAYPGLAFVRHAENQGKGAALATAMRLAHEQGYEAILSFDADGQHLAVDVPRLIEAYKKNPGSMIIGARDFQDPKSGDVTRSSRFGRQFSNFWIWVETGLWLPDTQTGLRIYPVDPGLLELIKGRRYSFEIEIISRSAWRGRPIHSVPVQVYYPPRAERVSHFKPWLDNMRLSRTHTHLCTLRFLKILGIYRPFVMKSGEMRGARTSAFFINKLGAPFAYCLMIFPVLSSFLWRAQERAAILAFYARVRPEWNHFRRWRAAFSNFWYFGASIVDRLAPSDQHLVPKTVNDQRQVEGRFPPPGSILVGAHYGDWFLIARQAAKLSGEVLGLVVNPGATPEFFAALEQRFGGALRILSVQQDMLGFALAVKEILDAGGRVCFLIDRAEGKGLATKFFQGEALVAQAPFALAARLRVPLHLICACKKGPWVRAPYQIYAYEIWNGADALREQELANRTMQVLEARVREAPQHWFNFMMFWREAPSS